MSEPVVATKSPFFTTVEKDKTYAWCSCGLSQTQPLCDGSHMSTDLRPIMYKAVSDGMVNFCGCKQSKKSPMCDGSHGQLG